MATRDRAYADSRAHFDQELAWLDLVLKREVTVTMLHRGPRHRFDEFSGMYVSEEEMSAYVTEGEAGPDAGAEDGRASALGEQARALRAEIDARVEASRERGTTLRLPRLAREFGLGPIEVRALICCLAPDVDLRFQRYFAYLQNDVTKKRPTLQLLGRLCVPEKVSGVQARALFGPDSPLLRHHLLDVGAAAAGREHAFPVLQPSAPDSVVDYLVGVDHLDSRIAALARLVAPGSMETFCDFHRHHQRIVTELARAHASGAALPLAYVWGPEGSGKAAVVETLAHRLGRRLVEVRCSDLLAAHGELERIFPLLLRDGRLHDAVLHLTDCDALLEEWGRLDLRAGPIKGFLDEAGARGLVLTGTRKASELKGALRRSLHGFEIPRPTLEERRQIWARHLHALASDDGPAPGRERPVDSGSLDSGSLDAGPAAEDLMTGLATRFRFTPGQIRAVLTSAGARAALEGGDAEVVSLEEIYRHCREESNQGLLRYAQKIVPHYGWNDIVVPDDVRDQLREICACVTHRRTVYSAWGFESKLSLGKGLNVLFSGESGTGKTMSSEIIANELGLDLYKIDLSCVVSKYVGETERNLSKIFEEAETSNAILFFDEADALFGKRSEVKDAHDRYANIEINYLLQKMDDYDGIVILATNLKGNLDPAFMRRLSYVVEFPFPDESYRNLIWRNVFPAAMPRQGDIDYDFLGKRFKLAGGNIKNIALNSAFLAAADGGRVGMVHVVLATKREYQKLGKLCSKSEFGPYYSHVREPAPS